MRAGQLLRFEIVLLLCLLSPAALFGNKDKPKAEVSVRQQVDLEVKNLQRNIAQLKTPDEKLALVQKTEDKIKNIRKDNAKQLTSDEIYFDLLQAQLAELPKSANFDAKKCPDYKTHLLFEFEPQAPDQKPHGESLSKVFSVLEKICK